ncbi:hypothetical protein AWV80_05425 [Cupriavidus sp. UYMU48A]|nr:hypothetical protein AWV80_05425 [Cupriavidus sp. UYMU48A]
MCFGAKDDQLVSPKGKYIQSVGRGTFDEYTYVSHPFHQCANYVSAQLFFNLDSRLGVTVQKTLQGGGKKLYQG